ncbi:MAG: hypothetical protein M3414_07145 [Pseudomonadota bacterium]|nr:hypothetical protein [Pseudomonadota bacterium]
MSSDQPTNDEIAARRKRALGTALWIGAVAVAVYVAFLLMGILGET